MMDVKMAPRMAAMKAFGKDGSMAASSGDYLDSLMVVMSARKQVELKAVYLEAQWDLHWDNEKVSMMAAH